MDEKSIPGSPIMGKIPEKEPETVVETKNIVIDEENQEIEVAGWKVKITSKTFWKYFGIGVAVIGMLLGIWSQIGA